MVKEINTEISLKTTYLKPFSNLLNENIFFSLEILLFIVPSVLLFKKYLRFKRKKYLILSLLFFSIFFLLNSYKYNIMNYFQEGNGYRLGDMVIRKDSRNQIHGEKFHYKFYPNSIASEYMRRTKKQENFETLLQIVKERNKNINQKEKDLIIHLRTGDDVNQSLYSIDRLLNAPTSHKIIKNYDYYNKLNIDKNKIKKIIIVSSVISGGGTTSNDDFSKSYEYIEKIKDFFVNKGYVVETRLNQDADEDFIFMSTAKNFVPSGGNYSKLIKNLVILNENIVYE
jgi:hypothetical protein